MGQDQAAGTAAALSAKNKLGSRNLKYADLRVQLEMGKVYFEG
jgi:hypothetical protein